MKDKFGYIPPTLRPVKAIYEDADRRIKELIKNNDDDLVTVKDLVVFASAMSEHLSGADRKIATEFIASALVNVEELLNRHPESKSLIMVAATNLILAGLRSTEDLVIKLCNVELSKARPFLEANSHKAAVVDRAKVIASEFWKVDTEKAIRIGEMADKVYRELVGEGFAESLPETTVTIKDWIKAVAPSYARSGGRSRKTP